MKKFTLRLICLAAIGGLQLHAEPAAPLAVLPTAAVAMETQTIHVAPKCIACTVGLVSTIANGNMYSVASGSAVLINAQGLMLTAGHVIQAPGTKLTVRFTDGRVYQGVAVGVDHATDTGLAKITDPAPAGGWEFAEMAPDKSAAIGEWVLCTGNPGSIVVDRDPPLRLGRVTGHDVNAIDTNCALEPGDSGGPLFDLQGRVVGINSRIMTSTGNYHPDEYLSMHVPISMFSTQMKELQAGVNNNPEVNLDGRNPRPKPVPGIGARARKALNKLAEEHDPEAMAVLADEKKTGKIKTTPALMGRLLKLAGEMDRAIESPSVAGDRQTPATQTPATQTPATQPAVVSAPPATAPAPAPALVAHAAPTTQLATQAIGVPLALRTALGPQLRQTLLKQYPDANISDALLSRIMDEAAFNPATGNVKMDPSEPELREMGVVAEVGPRDMGLPTNRASVEVGKTSLQTLALFAPAIENAGDCVVEIRDGNTAVLLGTIVGSDGWIVTKASDLPTIPRVYLPDGRVFRAHVVGKDKDTDLALLKVNVTGLTAARLATSSSSTAMPVGEWLAAPTANPNQPAVGVVSHVARHIPETFAHFEGEQKIVLGVGFNGAASLVVMQITKGMPAEAAGMKTGDEVFELNGTHVATHEEFVTLLKKAKAGDTLSIMVHRGGKDLELKPTIGEARATSQTANSIGEADNVAGGKLSKRRTNFTLALQTDAAIWADQCGGPLINLQGQTIGVTIARYDRVCTFALPGELVQATVARLKAAK